jgi:gentisate 1,2-dioxygenase
LWDRLPTLLTPEPRVRSDPYLWPYRSVRPLLLESATRVTAAEAERRVLILENPGLRGQSAITETLFAGLQLVMPGETEPAHRHSPAALRLIIEGSGAYTAVEHEKISMAPGDFIVTPSWTWHAHGHEGSGPFAWLDVLDLPTVRHLGAVFFEQESTPPRTELPDDLGRFRYGMNLRPVAPAQQSRRSPVRHYPYTHAREALERLKSHGEPDAQHGCKMQYVDPTNGGPALPTISTFIQLLPPGFVGIPYRSTEASVFCVLEGRGSVRFGHAHDVQRFEYAPRDVFVVPCWMPYALDAHEEAVLFSASDRVMQQMFGIWREAPPTG